VRFGETSLLGDEVTFGALVAVPRRAGTARPTLRSKTSTRSALSTRGGARCPYRAGAWQARPLLKERFHDLKHEVSWKSFRGEHRIEAALDVGVIRGMRSIRSYLSVALIGVLAAALSGCVSLQDSNPEIYDTHADGEQLLAEALQTARTENKRVLLDMGANWCSDSQGMFQLLTTNTPIRRMVQENYVFTMVDVNKNGFKARNEKLVERLGNPISNGIPKLLILDASGKVLNTNPDERLTDSDHDRPAIVLAYLRKWAGQTLHP
jgi:hypothetical protein